MTAYFETVGGWGVSKVSQLETRLGPSMALDLAHALIESKTIQRSRFNVRDVADAIGEDSGNAAIIYEALTVLAAAQLMRWEFQFWLDDDDLIFIDPIEAKQALQDGFYLHLDTAEEYSDVADRLVPVFTPVNELLEAMEND